MIKLFTKYLVFLIVSITIAASATLTGTYLITNIDEHNNNNDDTSLFPVAHAQSSSSSPQKTTVILNLEGKDESMITKDLVGYHIRDISTNETSLRGATLVDKDYARVVVSASSIMPTFTLHIPDTTNPNITRVKFVLLNFDVDMIETKPDGYKIYYGKSGSLSNKIGDNVSLSEGILIEKGPSNAQLLMYTKSSNNSPITTRNTTYNGTEMLITYQTTEKIIK